MDNDIHHILLTNAVRASANSQRFMWTVPIGYSDDGEIALIAATQQPERFKSVASGEHRYRPGYPALRHGQPGRIPGVDDVGVVAHPLHSITDPATALAEWVATFTQIINGGRPQSAKASCLTMPVLLIVGDSDEMALVSHAEAFVVRASRATLKVVPGGHAVHQEHLAALVAALEAFWHDQLS